MLPILFLAAITITTDFEGGSIGKVQQVDENHLRCAVKGETDQDGRNRQASWFYFQVDGAGGREITIDLVDLAGEYNYKPNKGGITDKTPPVISYDRKQWKRLTTVDYDPEIPQLRLHMKPEHNPVWIARIPPYTTEDLARLLDETGDSPYLKRSVIGKTVEGRDMLLLTVTDPATPDDGKKVLWLMLRQHSWEAGTSWVGEGALRFLLSRTPVAATIRKKTIFKVFPMCDPDGVARGGVRFNANGYDLNRNWDAVDPKKMPEIAAQRKAVLDWVDSGHRLDLFLTLHNTETAEYIDGPPVESPSEQTYLMMRFYHILRDATAFCATRRPRNAELSTAPGVPGRMTVNQALCHDRKIPAFLMEQMVAYNPKLLKFPTIEDRTAFGGQLVGTMWMAVR